MSQSNTKLTCHYVRISREDDRQGESYSIENQKALLKDFSKKNGFKNVKVFVDDGVSGVTDKRKEFQKLLSLVQEGKVGIIIVKDMSRLGRNYLDVGQYVEYLFPQHDVRLIAINDGLDTINGIDDFTPFRNIMNEWYAKDISRKRRSTNRTMSQQGYAIGQCPYGYRRDDANPKRWAVDDEAADVVRLIFQLRLQGESVTRIADKMKERKFLIPTMYAMVNGIRKPQNSSSRGEYFWNTSTVTGILKNQCYVGDVVNFKTYSRSFKLKGRINNAAEDWVIHRDKHPPIIERVQWEQVQRTFGKTKYRKPKIVEKHMLAGYLKCSDCGANLHYKLTYPNNANHYFSCGNNRTSKSLCAETHHIRVDAIEEVTRRAIDAVVRFANAYEDEFVKIVMSEQYKQIQLQQERNKKQLGMLKGRVTELDVILEQLYEDKVKGVITEEQFTRFAKKFENEYTDLGAKVKEMQKIVDSEKGHEMNVGGFIKLVRKYTRVNELTPDILRHFIDKIVVHHRIEMAQEKMQLLDFHFNLIGHIEIPDLIEYKPYLKSFARKKESQTA